MKRPGAGLTRQIVLAMLAGAGSGLLWNTLPPVAWVNELVVEGLLAVVGQMFIRSLTMLVVPLVFVSLVAGTCSLKDVSQLGRIMLAMVLQQAGLPVEGIGLILGVDRLLDMCRTAVNITGDAVVTCILAYHEGALNEAVYYGRADVQVPAE